VYKKATDTSTHFPQERFSGIGTGGNCFRHLIRPDCCTRWDDEGNISTHLRRK